MAHPIDYDRASSLLSEALTDAQDGMLRGEQPAVPPEVREAVDALFESRTQAFRETALGCVLAVICNPDVDVTLPYIGQGPRAYSGRSLDERAVNPFLHSNQIPASRGPFLAVFRRDVKFVASTGTGLRDKVTYEKFLDLLTYAQGASAAGRTSLLCYLVYRFLLLREQTNVPLARLQRLSVEQYGRVLDILLGTPSGGLFPVLLSVAMLKTINEYYGLNWNVTYQGINEADAASGAGGDITVSTGDRIEFAVEVTERVVDQARVVATFNTKIAPYNIEDYIFFIGSKEPSREAREQARQYFAQGHEVNFVAIRHWIIMGLVTLGVRGRHCFTEQLMAQLTEAGMPQALRVAWNQCVNEILTVS